MSGGGGAAGPRLYGYGGALPPAALLRRGLAAAVATATAATEASRVEGAAEGTDRAGLVCRSSFRPALRAGLRGGASPTPGSSPPPPAAARTADLARGEREGRFGAATPPPSAFCWLCVCFVVFFFFSPNLFFLILIFRPLFLALFRSGGFAGDKNSSAPPGEAGALPMRLPGTGGADSRSGFIDSRLVPSSPKQPGLVSVRIANCGEQ